MRRDNAVALLDRLHHGQNRYYQGGDAGELTELLAADIAWHVPGVNAIAGDYYGLDEVLAYMRRRRELAASTMRMHPRELLVGDADHVASRTDGTATIDGIEHSWSTLGLYRVNDTHILECWLLPLDPAEFDAIWNPTTTGR